MACVYCVYNDVNKGFHIIDVLFFMYIIIY